MTTNAALWNECAEFVRRSRPQTMDFSSREKQLAILQVQACVTRAAFPVAWLDASSSWEQEVAPKIKEAEEQISAIRNEHSDNASVCKKKIDETVPSIPLPSDVSRVLMTTHQWIVKSRETDAECLKAVKGNASQTNARRRKEAYLKCFAKEVCGYQMDSIQRCQSEYNKRYNSSSASEGETKAPASASSPPPPPPPLKSPTVESFCALEYNRMRLCRNTALRILQVLNGKSIPKEPTNNAKPFDPSSAQMEALEAEIKAIAKGVESFGLEEQPNNED